MSSRKSNIFYGFLIALASLAVGMVIASRLDLAPTSSAGTLNVATSTAAPLSGPIDAATFRNIARDHSPAVVSILTTARRPAQSMDDFFGLQVPFGNQSPRGQGRNNNGDEQNSQIVQGAGSGFLIDKDGYVLTNNHVIEGADRIEVKLEGTNDLLPGLPAKVIGRDTLTDTALLQLTEMPEEPLPTLTLGDSSQMAQGDWVMAIGNPFELSNTVTVGVVSAVARPYMAMSSGGGSRWEEMIQTDAAINRGNSGGPLLNIRGEVIGINTAIVSDQTGGNLGIGFAIPINVVRDILPELRTGKVVRGKIGVLVDRTPITPEAAKALGLPSASGAVITTVEEGPAGAAGMKPGDVVIEYNGKPVRDSEDLVRMVTGTKPNTTVPVKVVRDGKSVTLNVKVAELDLEAEQQQGQQNAPRRSQNPQAPQDTGFGMAVQGLTPQMARQLDLQPGEGGAIVAAVTPGGAAFRAGLQPGDVILQVNRQPMSSVDDVTQALDKVPSGATTSLLLLSGGQQRFVLLPKR